MADIPNDKTPLSNTEREEAMRREIASLQRDFDQINRTLAEGAIRAADRGYRSPRQLGAGAHSVSETLHQKAGAVSSAFLLGGIVGLILGTVVGQSDRFDRRWI